MVVTFAGIVIEVKPEQCAKAALPIVLSAFGRITVVNALALHLKNA